MSKLAKSAKPTDQQNEIMTGEVAVMLNLFLFLCPSPEVTLKVKREGQFMIKE